MDSSTPMSCLTIGGLDPCGAFGISADLKTFAAHQVHGMSVATVVTAQNSLGWRGAEFMSAEFVVSQLDAVLDDYGAAAIKTGFLGRVDLIEAIVERLEGRGDIPLVVDPVLVNAHGRSMFDDAVRRAYIDWLFPLAAAITPNKGEFCLLAGVDEVSEASVRQYSETLPVKAWLVVKGCVHEGRFGDWVARAGMALEFLPTLQVKTENVSGSGDTFSAALTAQLAAGGPPNAAIAQAQRFTRTAIERGAGWRLAHGRGPTGNF